MKPHADFACNSKTCKTKKGATVFDLPVNATRCPICGSKKLIRLFSAPYISRGVAKRSDAAIGPEYQRQREKKDAAKERQKEAPMLAVDHKTHGLAGGIQQAMARANPRWANLGLPVPITTKGESRPTPGITTPDLAGVMSQGMARGPRPDGSSKVWRPSAEDLQASRGGS